MNLFVKSIGTDGAQISVRSCTTISDFTCRCVYGSQLMMLAVTQPFGDKSWQIKLCTILLIGTPANKRAYKFDIFVVRSMTNYGFCKSVIYDTAIVSDLTFRFRCIRHFHLRIMILLIFWRQVVSLLFQDFNVMCLKCKLRMRIAVVTTKITTVCDISYSLCCC